MGKEAIYVLAQDGEDTHMSKFSPDDDSAMATYTVFVGSSGRWFCDCPAGANGRNCKHLQWAKNFRDKGCPSPYAITVDKKGNSTEGVVLPWMK